jgi:hypothetical protein
MSDRSGDVTVELTEGEYIAPRGKHEVTWLIRLNDAWAHVSKWPGAELQRIDARPAPYVPRDALDYLERAPCGASRRVIRQQFRVGKRGDLLRQP